MSRPALLLLLACLTVGLTSLGAPRSIRSSPSPPESPFNLAKAERRQPAPVPQNVRAPMVPDAKTIGRSFPVPSLRAPVPARTVGDLIAIAQDKRYVGSDRVDAIMRLGQMNTP